MLLEPIEPLLRMPTVFGAKLAAETLRPPAGNTSELAVRAGGSAVMTTPPARVMPLVMPLLLKEMSLPWALSVLFGALAVIVPLGLVVVPKNTAPGA